MGMIEPPANMSVNYITAGASGCVTVKGGRQLTALAPTTATVWRHALRIASPLQHATCPRPTPSTSTQPDTTGTGASCRQGRTAAATLRIASATYRRQRPACPWSSDGAHRARQPLKHSASKGAPTPAHSVIACPHKTAVPSQRGSTAQHAGAAGSSSTLAARNSIAVPYFAVAT